MIENILSLSNKIMRQVPDLLLATTNAPYIGPNYGSDTNCKILVIFLSEAPQSTRMHMLHPNHDSSIIDNYSFSDYALAKGPITVQAKNTQKKVEQAIKSISPNKNIEDIAHYHFILRLIQGSLDKPSPIDLDKSIDAFVKIIDILKPTNILFYGNDCLRTIARRSFSKALENKSVENYLSSKGISFATISRRSDYQAKTSASVANTKEQDNIHLSRYKDHFKNILNELSNYFTELKTDSAIAKDIFDTKISPTMKNLIAELDFLNNKINPQKTEDKDNPSNDIGMAKKTELIIKLAINNKKNNTTTSLSQLAEEFNKAGIRTARGETFTTTKTRGLHTLLAKVFEKNLFEQHDLGMTLAIATTFINEKTGLPWILNEVVDTLINQKLAFYENGVLKSKLSHKPITEQDIAPEIINETPMKFVDNKIKHEIIEYFANKQKAAGNKEIRESSPQEEKHHF